MQKTAEMRTKKAKMENEAKMHVRFQNIVFPKVVARKTQPLLAVQLVLAAQTQLHFET